MSVLNSELEKAKAVYLIATAAELQARLQAAQAWCSEVESVRLCAPDLDQAAAAAAEVTLQARIRLAFARAS